MSLPIYVNFVTASTYDQIWYTWSAVDQRRYSARLSSPMTCVSPWCWQPNQIHSGLMVKLHHHLWIELRNLRSLYPWSCHRLFISVHLDIIQSIAKQKSIGTRIQPWRTPDEVRNVFVSCLPMRTHDFVPWWRSLMSLMRKGGARLAFSDFQRASRSTESNAAFYPRMPHAEASRTPCVVLITNAEPELHPQWSDRQWSRTVVGVTCAS